MFKKLLIAVVCVMVLIGAGAAVALYFFDSALRTAIERGGTAALGTKTSLESIDVGFRSGEVSLHNLTIDNPPGFEYEHLLALDNAFLEVDMQTISEDVIRAPEISLDGIVFDVERNAQGTNYDPILDHLEQFRSTEEEPGPDEPTSEPGAQKRFVIDRLRISDVTATVNLTPNIGNATRVSLRIPEILVEELGGEEGLRSSELVDLVLRTLLSSTLEAGGSQIPLDFTRELRGKLDQLDALADQAKGVLSEDLQGKLDEFSEELRQKADEEIDELGKKAVEGLGGLLKKED